MQKLYNPRQKGLNVIKYKQNMSLFESLPEHLSIIVGCSWISARTGYRLKYQEILTPYGMWTLGNGALAANWKLNLRH